LATRELLKAAWRGPGTRGSKGGWMVRGLTKKKSLEKGQFNSTKGGNIASKPESDNSSERRPEHGKKKVGGLSGGGGIKGRAVPWN